MIKHDVIHMAIGLPAEGDGAGLALGADAGRPGRVVQAVPADLAAQILQVQELATIYSTGQLAQVAVEREVLDGRVKGGHMSRVPRV
jgi:thiamine pyrophosphate-dependent acetolactate synthase large subunit-like protein